MSANTPNVPRNGTPSRQRQHKSSPPNQRSEGRPLEPYFNDAVAGIELQSTQNGSGKSKPKQKPARKRHNQTPAANQRSDKHTANPRPPRPPEHGYHSESGTAHYVHNTRSRAHSNVANSGYPLGGVDGASTSQPVLASRAPPNLTPTPTKQVYAGPNFLASPAASSLPMPKAFAKAVSPVTNSIASHRPSSDANGRNETPVKPVSRAILSSRDGDSPLDFLFHADKAEKLRQTSHSTSPFSSTRPQALPRSAPRPQHVHNHSDKSLDQIPANSSLKDKFMQEVDGVGDPSDTTDSDDAQPLTPTYRQKMDNLRNTREAPLNTDRQMDDFRNQQTQTDALKQLLFANKERHSPTGFGPAPPSPSRGRKAASADMKITNGHPHHLALSPLRPPTSHMPSQQPRTTPHRSPPTEPRLTSNDSTSTTDIKTMEESLRKFLNIDS